MDKENKDKMETAHRGAWQIIGSQMYPEIINTKNARRITRQEMLEIRFKNVMKEEA